MEVCNVTLEKPRQTPNLQIPNLDTTITRSRFLSKALDKNNSKSALDTKTYQLQRLDYYSENVHKMSTDEVIKFMNSIDGRKHLPKKEQKLKTLYLWRHVKKIGFPKGYQILCYNCNIAKSTSVYCPHQLDRMKEN